jgi:hypothetical protein
MTSFHTRYPISLRFILLLSSDLILHPPGNLYSSGPLTKSLHVFLFFPTHPSLPAHFILLVSIILITGESQQISHNLIYDVNHVIFESGENIYFSIYSSQTLIYLPHRLTGALKPAVQKSFDCWLSQFRTWSGIICDFWTSLRKVIDPVVARLMRQTIFHRKQETCLLHWVHKNAQQNAALR